MKWKFYVFNCAQQIVLHDLLVPCWGLLENPIHLHDYLSPPLNGGSCLGPACCPYAVSGT